jgi:hypothetical protein
MTVLTVRLLVRDGVLLLVMSEMGGGANVEEVSE